MVRSLSLTVAAVAAMAVAGCDGGPTGSGGEAPMQVVVQGSEASSASASAPGDPAPRSEAGEVRGTVDFRARVYVRGGAGGWTEVTRGWTEQRVDLAGRDGGRVLADARVAAGSYDRVRVEFQRVRADVQGGVQIDLGLLQGEVQVVVGGDGTTTVERPVAVRASAEGSSRLRIDLNAAEWVRRADRQTRAVAEAEFRSAVRIHAEP